MARTSKLEDLLGAAPAALHADRLRRFREALSARGLDAAIVSQSHDVRYLSGFRGDDTVLLVGAQLALICTDSRYWAQVAEEVVGFTLEKTDDLLDDAVSALARELGGGARLGFQGGATTYADWRRLRRRHSGGLRDLRDMVLQLRVIKDAVELKLMAQAAAIVDQALELTLAEGIGGCAEREVAWRLEGHMRDLGAEGPSFETIVAAGPRAALPHAIPGTRVIEDGELVIIDAGARYGGYCSDITRTVCVGEPCARQRDVYDTVLGAQLAGLDASRAGVDGRRVDAAARAVRDAAGLGEHFGHGTGHGVGLEVHELPRLGKRRGDRLAAGMVHTVEPGVYLEGELGVRIEDTVVVTGAGCERLTLSGKSLRVVD
jgi:Xaa-Pro aminopeptidase